MVAEDIWGSMAHVTMLGHQKIIPATAAGSILQQLLKLQNGFLDGSWNIGFQQEDVHMNVEAKMIEALGMDVGGRMHTCRSRNDQVSSTLLKRTTISFRETHLLIIRWCWTLSFTLVRDSWNFARS